MDATFYGNSVSDYLIALGIAAGVIVLILGIRGLLLRKLANARETDSDVDDFALNLTRRTKLWLLIPPAIFLGIRALDIPADTRKLIQNVATIALIAQTALWCSVAIDFWLARYRRSRIQVEPQAVTTINAFRIAAIAAIWIVAVMSAIANLGFDITALIAGLGIGGVAVALAVQNILGDLFASLSIVLDKPFVVGDFIIVGTEMGTVEHIGLKTTQLRSLSGEQLIISNGDLLKSRIRNYKRMAERRVLFTIGVVYETPLETVEKIPMMIRAAIEQQQNTRVDRIHFLKFGDSALEFETVYWMTVSDYNAYADTQQAINLSLLRAFETAGIEFAYPTRTVYVNQA
ncbi:MAG TPA: mechanosensitive ion channel family protein [Thermoanaerobaculia bacterium]